MAALSESPTQIAANSSALTLTHPHNTQHNTTQTRVKHLKLLITLLKSTSKNRRISEQCLMEAPSPSGFSEI